jgi:hypothetical protein
MTGRENPLKYRNHSTDSLRASLMARIGLAVRCLRSMPSGLNIKLKDCGDRCNEALRCKDLLSTLPQAILSRLGSVGQTELGCKRLNR